MKKTSLYETHLSLGATMVPFAGWEMPVSYAGTVAEVAAVRSSAGIFDVSHMGEVTVTGAGAFEFVQSVTTNNVSKLAYGKAQYSPGKAQYSPGKAQYSPGKAQYSPGKAQYSLLLDKDGSAIDDIIVYDLSNNEYMIVLNAGCKDKDWAWLQTQAEGKSDVELTDISDQKALIAVQGPDAVRLVAEVLNKRGRDRGYNTDYKLESLKRFHFVGIHEYGMPLIISRTGYTGEDGFEIFCDWEDAPVLWKILTEAGATPAGLGARDVLRLEAAYPLYGHELDAETSPFESGVGWAVKMGKGDFIGRAALLDKTPTQQLVGLRMDARAIPREHYAVYSTDGVEVGQTTSGTWSPTVKAGIAMARLSLSASEVGTPVFVDIRGRRAPATVVKLPFYRNGI